MSDSVEIGLRVLLARRRAGLTQRELARRAGVVSDTVSRLERGLTVPETSSLLRIAHALGVSPSTLLDGERVAS